MDTQSTRDELKDRGAGRPASDLVVRLYHQAFRDFGVRALWNWRTDIARPTITQALTIADALRMEGNLEARILAVEIEQACRATL